VKHISVTICVSAVEELPTLCIITSQDSSSVREHIKKHVVRFGTDLILKSNAKTDINTEIFFHYVQAALLPNLAELWRLDESAEEKAMILMANCPSGIACVAM
jgi:hypothetical protein